MARKFKDTEINHDDVIRSFEFIEWQDHASWTDNDWASLTRNKKLIPVEMCSVGWVLKETKEYIVLCPHFAFDTGNGAGTMVIIKSCITHRKTIPFSLVYGEEKDAN